MGKKRKNHGGELLYYWVDAVCGYLVQCSCHQCENYWMTCRDEYIGDTSKDNFCHHKKSKFFWFSKRKLIKIKSNKDLKKRKKAEGPIKNRFEILDL